MPDIPEKETWKRAMVAFSDKLNDLIRFGKLGVIGGPWEINLRDLIRWCQAIKNNPTAGKKFYCFCFTLLID